MRDEKNKETDENDTLCMWQRMHREGAEFFVDGEAVLPREAVSKSVKEDGVYMTDYVWGEEGKIKQVRLNKVNPE